MVFSTPCSPDLLRACAGDNQTLAARALSLVVHDTEDPMAMVQDTSDGVGSDAQSDFGGLSLVEDDLSLVEDDVNAEVIGVKATLDVEVMRVLTLCHELISRKSPSDSPRERSETLVQICRVKRQLSSHTARLPLSRHRRFALSTDSRNLLKKWFDAHEDNPYPTPLEKQVLSASAKMTIKQVNDWFTNHRKRSWNGKLTTPELREEELWLD
jgi:hypothetical protein